ncbi:MAG: hypothetical protein CMO55_10275 [Verrucomicrobiales bacterium]|nr:hypothetical protein [Verrucomicrobiales bacterium]
MASGWASTRERAARGYLCGYGLDWEGWFWYVDAPMEKDASAHEEDSFQKWWNRTVLAVFGVAIVAGIAFLYFEMFRPSMMFYGNRGYSDVLSGFASAVGKLPENESELREWANQNWEHEHITLPPEDAFQKADIAWGLSLEEFYHGRQPFILSVGGDEDLGESLDFWMRSSTWHPSLKDGLE